MQESGLWNGRCCARPALMSCQVESGSFGHGGSRKDIAAERRSRQNVQVTIVTETLAEIVLDGKIRLLGANDAARSSFTAQAGDSLIALGPGLDVLGRWPVDPQHRGHHATCPDRGLALISGRDEVRLVDHTGRVRWRYPHPPWEGAFESGCTWFDAAGQPHAVIPDASYDHCLVVCLDLDSGQPRAESAIRARPAGISTVYHPDGWVGLSEGEGQDAAQAWWVRSVSHSPGEMSIEVLDGGWKSWIFIDVDPSGSKVITTPHMGGPILVRSFPSLEIVRSIEPPPGESWIERAFFAGEMIVGGFGAQEDRFVAISERGRIIDLDQPEARYLVPADHGTWMAVTQTVIRRCQMTGREEEIPIQSPDEQIPGQTALW